jgi:hypothetical protein
MIYFPGWVTLSDLLTNLGSSTQSQSFDASVTADKTRLDYIFDKYDYNRNGYLDRLELFWLTYDIFGLLGIFGVLFYRLIQCCILIYFNFFFE